MANSSVQKLIDAGVEFTEMSKKQAEAFVKNLVSAGEVQRQDAEKLVQTLVERGRETSEKISALVQQEVAKQVNLLAGRFDDIEDRVEQLAASVRGGAAPAAKKAPAKKAPAKKKAAAKKAPAKKKAAAKKAPAKKAVGSSGVRKVSTSKSS